MPRAFFLTLFCGDACDPQELRELQKTIFSEGESADNVFGLSQGVVRLYKVLPAGRRQVLTFALPGDFLGMPLADRHSFSADESAKLPCVDFHASSLQDSFNPIRIFCAS
jgi:hypothetical protein